MFVFPGACRALLLAYRWNIHLRTMSDGDPHPSARAKVLSCALALGGLGVLEMSITSSRLAFLGEAVSSEHKTQLIVWNWITGEQLLVCQLLLGGRTLADVDRPLRNSVLGTACLHCLLTTFG